jgi:hypothetical protein
MKVFGIIFSLLLVNLVNANELLVCKSVADDSHTVVVRSHAVGKYELATYRSKYGHTFPPDKREVFIQPSANRAVVTFADFNKVVKLSYSLIKPRNVSYLQGEFLDASVSYKSVPVRCTPSR